jgi:hypothetical protein
LPENTDAVAFAGHRVGASEEKEGESESIHAQHRVALIHCVSGRDDGRHKVEAADRAMKRLALPPNRLLAQHGSLDVINRDETAHLRAITDLRRKVMNDLADETHPELLPFRAPTHAVQAEDRNPSERS